MVSTGVKLENAICNKIAGRNKKSYIKIFKIPERN